jgi:hypothetical protein
MPLAQILHIPEGKDGLLFWSFSHDQQHQQIVQALNSKFALSLPVYILNPISETDFEGWITRHQQAHNDFNAALNFNGADLSGLDLNDPKKVQAFEWFNFVEHQNACAILGLA